MLFSDFTIEVAFPPHLPPQPCLIRRAPIDTLRAVIYEGTYEAPKVRLTRLEETPHFKYLQGDSVPYIKYMTRFQGKVGWGIEHSEEAFRQLTRTFRPEAYLRAGSNKHYIICEERRSIWGTRYVILDGVHRATLLKREGASDLPIAVYRRNASPEKQVDQLVRDYATDFEEWYTPIKFTDSCTIHERTYPDFRARPEYLTNRERGIAKWDYIIRRNLPDVTGLTIHDVGCNCGLFSIELARLGASRVVGYDRDASVVQPSNVHLPRQDVVNQAYFVKLLFETLERRKFPNVSFQATDIDTLDFSRMRGDMLFSCCVLYHFADRFPIFLRRAAAARLPVIFLQTNLGHSGELAHWASIDTHDKILQELGYRTRIDAPEGYMYPVIVGRRE